jgi:hypothetical protein
MPGSREEALMRSLLAPLKSATKKDEGEAASIAIAKWRPDLVFVTGDRTATLWALNELYGCGERVMRSYVFVRVLYEAGAITLAAVTALDVYLGSRPDIPRWWVDCIASLPP